MTQPKTESPTKEELTQPKAELTQPKPENMPSPKEEMTQPKETVNPPKLPELKLPEAPMAPVNMAPVNMAPVNMAPVNPAPPQLQPIITQPAPPQQMQPIVTQPIVTQPIAPKPQLPINIEKQPVTEKFCGCTSSKPMENSSWPLQQPTFDYSPPINAMPNSLYPGIGSPQNWGNAPVNTSFAEHASPTVVADQGYHHDCEHPWCWGPVQTAAPIHAHPTPYPAYSDCCCTLDIIRVMKRLKIHPILSILHLSTKGVRSSNQRVQSRVASGATHGEDHNIVCLQVDTCPTLANQWLNTPRIIHIIRSHMEMHLCIH